jgi:hypothetical protein
MKFGATARPTFVLPYLVGTSANPGFEIAILADDCTYAHDFPPFAGAIRARTSQKRRKGTRVPCRDFYGTLTA